jgi:hypothetical protein
MIRRAVYIGLAQWLIAVAVLTTLAVVVVLGLANWGGQ